MSTMLEWGILATSLGNVVLLLWLALTVLVHGQRRTWGTVGTVGALGTGALFFLFHAVVISLGLDRVSPGIIARWPLVWAVGFVLPCAWYLVMLWYGGYWAQPRAARHALWHRLFLTGLAVAAGILAVLVVLYPISPLRAYPPAWLLSGPTIGGFSSVALVYALLVCGCTVMAVDILLFPASSSRLLEDLARRRARAWLIATSLVLLAVSLLLGWVLLSTTPGLLDRPPALIPPAVWRTLVWSDLLLSLLVTVAVLLLGQAIVIYELFTGAALPRRGLRQQWRTIVLVAAVFAAPMAYALVRHVPSIFSVLLTAVLLAASYALHSWRSSAERERFMASLRPIIAGPRIIEALQPGEMPDHAALPFRTLCEQVLGARWACLAAAGPFAALAPPLVHPESAVPGIPAALLARCTDPDTLCLPVASGECGEATWAVPLWSTRGLIGLLLLGDKRNGGIYTREEMEVARTAGERLIDALAGAQIGRRLLQVQRARLTEEQLADRRTRRVIHDDILPQIHAAMLALSADPAHAGSVAQLAETHHALAALLRELPATAVLDIAHHGIIGALRAHVERSYPHAFTAQQWRIDAVAEQRLRALSPLAAEVVYGAACEAVRNAARYGRGEADLPLTLTVTLGDTVPLALTIADDGIGLAHAAPSVGSGQGVLLHSAMMAIIGGAWTTAPHPGPGTCVTLTLPEEGAGV